jgi:hypothetical protein
MKLALAGVGFLATGILVAFLYSSSAVADDRREPDFHPDIEVSWSPRILSAVVKPGETVSIPVTFTAREKLDGIATIYAAKSLQGIVAVTPTSFPALGRGQSATITVQIKLPILQEAGTTTGFIQLYETGRRWKKPMPIQWRLPIRVDTIWASISDPATGISFSYPEFGGSATVSSSTSDFGGAGVATIYDVSMETGTTSGVTSGAFQNKQYRNGIQSLVLAGPIPSNYDAGPVSNLYAMSQSGATVLAIVSSQDQTLSRELGISREVLQASFEHMLDDMVLP